MNMPMEETKARRKLLAELIAAENPRLTSYDDIMEHLAEHGYDIRSEGTVTTDLRSIKAVRVKDERTREYYWTLEERMRGAVVNDAVAEVEARVRVRTNGLKVLSLDGAVPIMVQTTDMAGHLTGQPFSVWRPPGVIATLSGNDGVVFWCEAGKADEVKAKLTQMMLAG